MSSVETLPRPPSFPNEVSEGYYFAPMEGVTDPPMRALASRIGGFNACVTEFLRVSEQIPPRWIFFEHMPELEIESRTRHGLPVILQLLGGDPEKLAETAYLAVSYGATAIDLNFGCPAPTVNRHDGGASLLRYPLRIRGIVEAVRKAIPSEIPVSAKLRLGWDTPDPIIENSVRAAEGGADWITIHARTKVQGYQPPAYWQHIGEAKKQVGKLPVIANGDIWNIDDLQRCRELTGCSHFMLGRGWLANPSLALRAAGTKITHPTDWFEIIQLYVEECSRYESFTRSPFYIPRRIKQWFNYARRQTDIPFFDEIKRLETLAEILPVIEKHQRSQS